MNRVFPSTLFAEKASVWLRELRIYCLEVNSYKLKSYFYTWSYRNSSIYYVFLKSNVEQFIKNKRVTDFHYQTFALISAH